MGKMPRRFQVALAALALSACGADASVDAGDTAAPAGIYVSTCDAGATIDFQQGGVAEVNRNFCEGYGQELWDYAVEGDTLTMALPGKVGDPGSVQERFQIPAPGQLVLESDTSFIACGNCKRGDTWAQQ